jgi:hypothetical protein
MRDINQYFEELFDTCSECGETHMVDDLIYECDESRGYCHSCMVNKQEEQQKYEQYLLACGRLN